MAILINVRQPPELREDGCGKLRLDKHLGDQDSTCGGDLLRLLAGELAILRLHLVEHSIVLRLKYESERNL